jgi:DNA mismatch endonuclease (patch repair protein)
MPDFLTKKQRSVLMSKIRSKDTKPELEMARLLSAAGIGFERHVKGLPGTPDFVINGRRLAVFVSGTFWHGRNFEEWSYKLKPYWLDKISGNIRRDKRVDARLRRLGYGIIHVWEDDVFKRKEKCVSRVLRKINGNETFPCQARLNDRQPVSVRGRH